MFFKKKTENKKNFLVKHCALLIHAAKIDENLLKKKKKLLKKLLLELGADKENIPQN